MPIFKPVLLIFLFATTAFSVAPPQPRVVNIDSPHFRKLKFVVPKFINKHPSHQVLNHIRLVGSKELSRLLEFTGLFKTTPAPQFLSNPKGGALAEISFHKEELGKLDRLGIDSIIMVQLKAIANKIQITMRTANTHTKEIVLSRVFQITNGKEITKVFQTYADLLLQEYTGRPGIFQSKIVFVGRKQRYAEKQIFVANIDGTELEQITHEDTIHMAPAWSPDGKNIIYTSFVKKNPNLYMFNLKTKKTRLLASKDGINSGAKYSPGGKLIVYTGTAKGDAELFIMRPEDQNVRRPLLMGRGIDVEPTFSPDGKWLAFVSGRYGNPHIFRASLKWSSLEKEVKVLEDRRLTYAGWYNATPAWSPDSNKIAFTSYDRDKTKEGHSNFDVFIMNYDGHNMERLTLSQGDNEGPTWSPNGHLIMFTSNRVANTNQKGPHQLYLMEKDGSNTRMIHTGLYEVQTPQWSMYFNQ